MSSIRRMVTPARAAQHPSGQVTFRDRPMAVVPSIGAPARDRCRKRDIRIGRRLTPKFDRGQVLSIGGIRKPVDLAAHPKAAKAVTQ